MRDEGVDSVVMEVSSHALALRRVDGTLVRRGGLHQPGTRSSRPARVRRGVLPSQGTAVHARAGGGRRHQHRRSVRAPAPGRGGHPDGAVFEVGCDRDRGHAPSGTGSCGAAGSVAVPIGGAFNVMNSLAALTALDALGVDADEAAAGVSSAGPVPGRFEVIAPAGETAPTVIVDYAHTPDGITELLAADARGHRLGRDDDRVRLRRRPRSREAGADGERRGCRCRSGDRDVRQPARRGSDGDHRRHRRAASRSATATASWSNPTGGLRSGWRWPARAAATSS